MESPEQQLGSARGADFLLAEFDALCTQRISLVATTNNEINMYFAVVTAVGVAGGFVRSRFVESDAEFLLFGVGLLFVLALVGLLTFHRVIRGRIQIYDYVRAMNLIRRFFVNENPEIANFVRMPIRDNIPRFGAIGRDSTRSQVSLWNSFHGHQAVVGVVNSCVIAALVMAVARLGLLAGDWGSKSDTTALMALSAFVAFSVSCWAHWRIQQTQFEKAETEYHPRFPESL